MILLQLAIFIHLAAPIPSQMSSDLSWDQALGEVRRVSPAEFKELRADTVRELERRKCRVPQAYESPRRHNVIKGNFSGKGRIDWAVLCSRDAESSILVFKGETGHVWAEFAKGPDRNWLQEFAGGKIGYSRTISVASGTTIRRYLKEFGGIKPPTIDHDAIEDIFAGKTSAVVYYSQGTWLTLTGAD